MTRTSESDYGKRKRNVVVHDKYTVIDGQTMITGSFNLTKGADESNAESLLVIKDKSKIARAYAENFEALLKKSKPYQRQ